MTPNTAPSDTRPDGASGTPVIDGLHPRLAGDCHVLGRLDHATLLLHHNALVAWLILVPDTDSVGWHELDDAEHDRISGQIRRLTSAADDFFSADRMNVAAIGNEVPQMHIHVVARHVGDACWPRPVWGHLPDGPAYSATRLEEIRAAFVEAIDLQTESRDNA